MVNVKEGSIKWNNLHNTYSQQITGIYNLANDPNAGALDGYNDTTIGIQQIIADAIASNTPLRALGGNWSLSPITATSGIILNTKPLNNKFNFNSQSVHSTFSGDPSLLLLAQCGNGIWELNQYLAGAHQSLPASGASNGQTIAGAIATGTHGAGISFGATQDSVVGFHIITSPTSSIWLERASEPILADDFAGKLNATLLRDDEAFNAALVSVGAFGFIHGVLIRTEPQYLLRAFMKQVPIDDELNSQLTSLDFNYSQLPEGYQGVLPFHFGVLFNPYDTSNQAYMTVMYKIPYTPDYTPPPVNGLGIGPADDAASFIGTITDIIPGSIPTLVNTVLGGNLKPYNNHIGRLGEIFNNTTLRGKVASTAMGFSPDNVLKVIKLLMDINSGDDKFVGVFAFRYVKASKATMAFTRFAPITCVLELDGVQSAGTTRFYNDVWTGLQQLGIPFTFHWGKMNILDADMVQNMYGPALDSFLSARARVVTEDTLRIFSNAAIRNYGLDTSPSVPADAPVAVV